MKESLKKEIDAYLAEQVPILVRKEMMNLKDQEIEISSRILDSMRSYCCDTKTILNNLPYNPYIPYNITGDFYR